MIYFTIVFLCTAGLFLALLEDRFRFWATLISSAAAYLLSLGAAFALRGLISHPVWRDQASCMAGCLLFFVASLIVFRNNPLQKFFVALLSLCDFAFLGFFLPLLLGVLPFSVSGGWAGALSVLIYCLFTLLMGLCLYRPFHHFSDRGVSGFLIGMCLILIVVYIFSLGKLDFLFRTNIPAARLLAAALLYCGVIFGFRSLYQAGRFREKSGARAAEERLLEREASAFSDRLAAVKEVRRSEKAGEYALDTVSVMLADGYGEKIPVYVKIAKENAQKSPVLQIYHENPRLNAVIAMKAALAAQDNIDFQCNAVTGNVPMDTDELCVIVDEMLTRACRDAAGYDGPRKLRFTAFPAENSLRLEAVYSAKLPEREKFTPRGKKLSDVLAWLFDDSPQENDLWGLDNTGEVVSRYSGKLTVSGSGEEVILQAALRF